MLVFLGGFSSKLIFRCKDKYHVYFLTEFLGGGDLFYAIRLIGVWGCPVVSTFFFWWKKIDDSHSDFLLNFLKRSNIHPIESMGTGIFTYICNKNQLNVGKYI